MKSKHPCNQNSYYVYEWFIIPTGEIFYVGKGKNQRYKSLKSRNKFFLDMYCSHECDVRIIAKNLSEKEAFETERHLIKYYRNHTPFRLTNQTDGGDGASGYRHSEDTKKKIALASKRMWDSLDFRNSAKELRINPNGPYQSKSFRYKISQKTSGSNNPNYCHFWSEEKKEALRKQHRESGRYNGANNPRAKKIRCVETGEIFDCIKEAQQKYSVKSQASFSIALNKANRIAAKLHWITV